MKRARPRPSQWSLCGPASRFGCNVSSWSLAVSRSRPHCCRPREGSAEMDCLWITLADPKPATNGQLIYSEGLIEAARGAGASLCVVGLRRHEKPDLPADQPDLAWRLGEE